MTSSEMLSESTIRKALREFDIDLDARQVIQTQTYLKLLMAWNDKVNLTAIREPREMLYRHFCESMFAVRVADLENCRLADIGSGAGFPGLALAIVAPNAHMFLVEANAKKATFMGEVLRGLKLSNAKVFNRRFEELGAEIAPVDYVCARALGDFKTLLTWARSQAIDGKHVMLWLGAGDVSEVEKLSGWRWKSPVPVPQSLRRVILVGSKLQNQE
jgi:16S rRNA (guanine527-N7)-methyltransferase